MRFSGSFIACSSSSCEVGEEEEDKCLKRRGEGEGGKGSILSFVTFLHASSLQCQLPLSDQFVKAAISCGCLKAYDQADFVLGACDEDDLPSCFACRSNEFPNHSSKISI